MSYRTITVSGDARIFFKCGEIYFLSAMNFDIIALDDKKKIVSALRVIEAYTCVKFFTRQSEEDFITFRSKSGCSSYLGKVGGEQIVSVNKHGCLSRGTIQHEVIHALGYDHMQNHADRDTYISINFRNIKKDVAYNFEKVSAKKFSNFDTPYDYYSVMHYDGNAFAIDRSKPTITAKEEKYNKVMGQRRGVSIGDLRRINRMYKCKNVLYH